MKAKTTPPQLQCPHCKLRLSVPEVFDNCAVSWPNQRWLGFECPRCKRGWHVEVMNGHAGIGDIDGAPGPAFFPKNSARVPGLTYTRATGGITLRLGRRRWRVKARE